MVSFCCEVCNETVPKKKAGSHYGSCPQAVLACIDCSTTFPGRSWQSHTQCMTEAEKYRHNAAKRARPNGSNGTNSNDTKAAHEAGPKKSDETKATESDNKESTASNESKSKKESKSSKDTKKSSKHTKESKESKNSKETKQSDGTVKAHGAVKVQKKEPLSRVLRRLRKEHSLAKNDLLNRLSVLPDGRLAFN